MSGVAGAIGALVALSACTQSGNSKTFGQATDGIPSEYRNVTFDAPLESCGLATVGHGTLKFLASVMPLGFRAQATHSDSIWSPSGVTSVLPFGDSLVVLDGRQSKLSVFNEALELVATFGRTGDGPGEFRRASAIAHDGKGRLIVADPGNGRLSILTPELRLNSTSKFPALQNIEAIAALDSGVYVSRFVVPELMARDPRNREVLGMFRPGGDSITPIMRLEAADPDADTLLRLPGPNPFRVVATGRYVLLIAPPIGVVDVFRDGRHLARLRTCMPLKLDRALTAQLKAYRSGNAPNSQQWHPLVTDAIVVADTVFVIGPLRDARKQLHIDKYQIDGSPIGSIVVPIGDSGFPEDVKFWGRPSRLIAYGPQGTLMSIAIEIRE